MLRNMNTKLKVAATVNMGSLDVLAREFREEFEVSSEVIHARLSGRRFVFNRDGRETYPFDDWESPAGGEAVPMEPSGEVITIASTDSSCILLGETSDSSVYAVRAAVSFATQGSVQGYLRIGPLVVHLSSKGACGLPTPLEGYELRVALSDHYIAERIIRNTVEKRIVGSLLSFPERMLVIADGMLKHPLDSYPEQFFREGGSGSSLVGISKTSALISSNRLSAVVSRSRVPAYAMVEDGLVQTLLAKFAKDGLVFRVDLARSKGKVPEVLGSILSNDNFSVGYPESLRIAHHLSVFTRSEDMALKAYLTNRYALKQLNSFGLRRIALGALSNTG
jgi:hypothetical protein